MRWAEEDEDEEGTNVTQMVTSAPMLAATQGSRSAGLWWAPMKLTNWTTIIRGRVWSRLLGCIPAMDTASTGDRRLLSCDAEYWKRKKHAYRLRLSTTVEN